MTERDVVTVRGLRKAYGTRVVVHELDLDVRAGEIVGLAGANGAGKTTTVECIQGLRSPDAGSLRVLGYDPSTQAAQLRPLIGSQLQDSALPDRLRQPTFERTGGLHATGLFSSSGELELVREDVGRHNAMDKVIGAALRSGRVPLADSILCVSGRLAFELVQKAAVAGAPILVGVGAPTSLAVELAADRAMTLAGFARGGRVNVYCGEERLAR